MRENNRFKHLAIIQSCFFLLLLALLVMFEQGENLILGGVSLSLLIAFHLLVAYRFTSATLAVSGPRYAYVAFYLLLCTLVSWTTRGAEESPFWIVFFLPIIITASNFSLKATLATCSTALLLFAAHLPPHMYLDPKKRIEEFPEMLGFCIMFFMVGILVQYFAQQHRRQLELKQQLNEKLLENQQHLKASLARLSAAEESLRTKERLASLGEMSAGIAHEIRNPLGIISSSAQLLNCEITSADSRQFLDIIQEESSRLNDLITEFLTFGRQLEPQRQLCDLSGLIMRCLDSLENAAEQQGVTIEFEGQCETCSVQVDPDMLQQVLLNLLLNALDATPAGGSVKVTLLTQASQLDILINDNGCGIPPENLGKVFDPFFTTKSSGTGLGLANSYQIIQSHQGSLSVTSQLGSGSTFKVSLPLEAE